MKFKNRVRKKLLINTINEYCIAPERRELRKIVLDISKNIFKKDFQVNKLLKLKFINMIFTNTNIIIESRYSNNVLLFKIYDDNKKYSDGKICFV